MAGVVLFAVVEPKLCGNAGGGREKQGPKAMLFTNLKMQRLRKYTTSNVWLKVTKGASIATIRHFL